MEPFGAALLKSSAAAVAIAAGALCLRSLLSPSPAAADLSARAAKARASRDAARDAYKRSRLVAPWPAPSDHSPAAENMRHICSLNATALLEEMTAGRLTSVQVMRAFCSRALHVGERLDTNAQECFADALAAAEEADSARAAGRPLGALHGLPVSVKDQLDMAGCDSTCGLQVRCGAPAEHDSLLVKLLRDQGARSACASPAAAPTPARATVLRPPRRQAPSRSSAATCRSASCCPSLPTASGARRAIRGTPLAPPAAAAAVRRRWSPRAQARSASVPTSAGQSASRRTFAASSASSRPPTASAIAASRSRGPATARRARSP